MATIGSLLPSPDESRSTSTVTRQLKSMEGNGAQLLELRNEAGTTYVRPSRWQRIRLRWTFRRFHVLPPQVLSRHDRRLIEKLSRSAVVTPALPVPRNTVFGVVEKVRPTLPAAALRMVAMKTEVATTQATPPATRAQAEIAALPREVRLEKAAKGPGGLKARDLGGVGFQQWEALGALAAVGFLTVLASVYGIPLFSGAGQGRDAGTLAASLKQGTPHLRAVAISLLPVATDSLPGIERLKRRVAPLAPETSLAPQEPAPVRLDQSVSGAGRSVAPTIDAVPGTIPEPAPMVASAVSERRFVSELPQGHFAHPVVSERNLVGELRLKALIGADGSVKEVTVLSGTPELAEAGMRAVRQWHYIPYQVLGSPVEVETQIKMSFFGQDAVSIASVASESVSQLK
jgi:Gram-negative bacterial TonB protein C-terminal